MDLFGTFDSERLFGRSFGNFFPLKGLIHVLFVGKPRELDP